MLKQIFSWFFRSVTGIAGLVGGFLAAIVAVALGAGVFASVGLGFTVLALAFLVTLSTKAGMASLIGSRDSETRHKAATLLEEAGAARKSLAALRLPDGSLTKTRDRLVLEVGQFLEASTRRLQAGSASDSLPLYDPAAIQAILDSRALFDATLRELDAASTDRRFSQSPIAEGRTALAGQAASPVSGDIAPLPLDRDSGSRALAAVDSTMAALEERIHVIIEGRMRIDGRLELSQILAADKELR